MEEKCEVVEDKCELLMCAINVLRGKFIDFREFDTENIPK